MDWQQEQQQRHKQQQAEKERLRQEAAEQERLRIKARFVNQSRRETEQAAERALQQAAKEQREKQQQAEVAERLVSSLKILDQQRQELLQEAALKRQQDEIIKKQGSPIENSFYEAWCAYFPHIELKRQYQIGKYRVDFAHVESHTVIELDGYEYHHTSKDRNKDYQRQHDIEDLGWYFVRFTGSQIFTNVASCVAIAGKRILQRS